MLLRGMGARAHGEVGLGALVLFRCVCVYRRGCRGWGRFGGKSSLGKKGHYANQCQKTTNNNAQGRAYMLRDRNAHQNLNVVTGAAPVAHTPYRLVPSEMQELSDQLQELADREIHQFLGLAGYYRRFIKDFSKIAKSLTELTQKNKKYIWGKDLETAFQLLKQKLCEAPILALPEGNDDLLFTMMHPIK
nr:reverse transcriptase domain-containing protein [Tanacetum cinerariifolium]